MVRSPRVPNPGNSPAPLRLHHPGLPITALAEPRRRSVHLHRVEFPLACSAFQDRIAYLSLRSRSLVAERSDRSSSVARLMSIFGRTSHPRGGADSSLYYRSSLVSDWDRVSLLLARLARVIRDLS